MSRLLLLATVSPRLEALKKEGEAGRKALNQYTRMGTVVLAAIQAFGIGAGQQNRLDSARIAADRAAGRAVGGVCASDAFFPFRDGLDAAASAGISAIIQPGGSVRDDEVIAAANEHGVAMVFTDQRHFRH